jgi:hypothetical protein
LRAQINGAYRIPDPPCLSTFKGGGGGPESGAHLSDGPDQRARINGDEDHSGPPPPAFLPLSGGGGSGIADAAFRRPRSRSPDQRLMSSLIPLSYPDFNRVGPSPIMSSSLSAFPVLPCVIHPPPLFGPRGPPFSSSTHSLLATCPFPFHVSLSPEGGFIISRLPPFHLMSSAMNHPLSPFSHLATSSTSS